MLTQYLYSATAGFFSGVALALLGTPLLLSALILCLSAVVICLLWRSFKPSTIVIIMAVFLLASAFGMLRTGFDINEENERVFDSQLGETVEIEAVVSSVPAVTESGQNTTVVTERLYPEQQTQALVGETGVVVYTAHFPQLTYGDKVRLTGTLTKPTSFQGDAGRLFNYPQYLARQEVFYEMVRPEVKVLAAQEGNLVKGWLATLRRDLLSTLHKHIPDPHAALTGGVLLGAEDALGEKLQTAFRDTGLIHIVVLSGYNVTIVAVAIGAALLFIGLPVAVASAVAGVGIAAFALLVGLTPTVVRASIMAIIALIGRVFARSYAAGRGLLLAALIMVAVNPHILLFDPSFQLSAVATAGLIGFGDQISNWLLWLPEKLGIREAATATIAAQISVLPLLAFYMGEVSVVSLAANVLVLPVVPVLMAAGTLTALAGIALPPLALPFAGGSYLVSEYIFTITEWLASQTYATATVGIIPIWVLICLYAVLLLGFWLLKPAKNQTRA